MWWSHLCSHRPSIVKIALASGIILVLRRRIRWKIRLRNCSNESLQSWLSSLQIGTKSRGQSWSKKRKRCQSKEDHPHAQSAPIHKFLSFLLIRWRNQQSSWYSIKLTVRRKIQNYWKNLSQCSSRARPSDRKWWKRASRKRVFIKRIQQPLLQLSLPISQLIYLLTSRQVERSQMNLITALLGSCHHNNSMRLLTRISSSQRLR